MYLSRRSATLTDNRVMGDDSDLRAINALSHMQLTWDDVYIRSMFLCSDQPCESDWSRFSPRALEQIARLLVGQSVIGGHDRQSLPLARFFKANIVQRQDDITKVPSVWVQAWFYWLRETSGANDLLLNIDGGIYREVSIAWRYRYWQCSICGQEDGVCRHRPGELIGDERCLRIIDEILDVLEGSLVYKGADSGAMLAGSRSAEFSNQEESILCIWRDSDALFRTLVEYDLISDISQLESDDIEALRGSAPQLWVNDLLTGTPSDKEPHTLLSPGGWLVTLETDGSIRSHLNSISDISVESFAENEDSEILLAQRLEQE